ncbi:MULTISPECIES: helix-turn-helix domain-containing protein [Paraliobacillus]|uniref:winged helix-turn-helix transcriptional regulator n=1 Tax=Paraliobacillus TaxID=200903 RepID=UPI000DD48CC3|nr:MULTISPECIES: helix-turn-helix domain-containing protein [Paraliobacillus]
MDKTYEHPIEVTLNVVCGKWKALILCHLLDRTMRFGELQKKIPKISKKMLAQQLRELEKEQLIEREIFPEVPPKVEYTLTKYGRDLEETLYFMTEWGKEHRDKFEKSGA